MAYAGGVVFVAVLALMGSVQGYTSKRLYATTNRIGEYLYSYNNNDRRSFYISPSAGFSSSSYYLEITWSRFDVRGYMPYCHNDRVEVYLTLANKTTGRFCSYNAGSPFTMYSYDGYARIDLISDSKTTGSGFTFYYKLRSKTSDPIMGSRYSTYCYRSSNYASAGTIFSAGWPDGYQSSDTDCKHLITRSSSYAYTKFVFMDVDLAYSGDSVEIYGSSSSSGYKYYLHKATSTNSYISTYTTSRRYLKVEFERSNAPRYSRGFVLGYIQYGKSSGSTTTDHSGSSGGHFSFSYLTPVILVIILAVSIPYIKRRRQLLAMRRNNVTVTVTTRANQGTAGSDPPEAVPPAYPQSQPPFSQPYPTSYGGSPFSSAPPPNYAYSVASENKPAPGNVPPPYPDFQSQYPAPAPYPPVTSAFSSNMQVPDAPPPSYDAAVQK